MNKVIRKGISLLITAGMLMGTVPVLAEETTVPTDDTAIEATDTVVEAEDNIDEADAVVVEADEEEESTIEFPKPEFAELAEGLNSGMLVDLNFDDKELGDYSSNLTFASGVTDAQNFEIIDGAEVGREGKLLKISYNQGGSNQKVKLADFALGNADKGDRYIVTAFDIMTDNIEASKALELTIAGGNSGANVCGGFKLDKNNLQLFTDDASKGTAAAQSTSARTKNGEWHQIAMLTKVSTSEGATLVEETTYAIDGISNRYKTFKTTQFDSKGADPNMLRFVFNTEKIDANIYIDNLSMVDILPTLDYYVREFKYNSALKITDFVEYDEDSITLPTSYNGVGLVWKSSDTSIINTDAMDENGVIKVEHGEETVGATLTAYVSIDSMYGVKYPDEVAAVSEDGIQFPVLVQNKYGKEDSNSKATRIVNSIILNETTVTDNFELPVTTDIVDSGATITWTSADEQTIAIDGANAIVTRPAFDAANNKVKLTVTVTYEGAVASKTIEVTVVRNEAPVNEVEDIRYAAMILENAGFTEAMPTTASHDLDFPTQIGNAAIVWESSDTNWITNEGVLVQKPAKGDGKKDVTVKATVTSGTETKTYTFVIEIKPAAAAKAFPGAQGYGTQTRGGAGGYVVHVTNLNAEGQGSLKWALEDLTGARIIVFDVGGTIDLTPLGRALKLSGKGGSNVTVAGQTAPGQGIQLKGYGLTLSSVEDVIIRNIKIRIGNVRKYGDTYQSDPLSVSGANRRVVLDHISMNWGVDMGFRVDGTEVTMSNCMVSKGLYWNTPHEKGKHNYAGMFRAKYGTFYNNYIADSGQRAPRIIDNEYIDVRNNVVYNSKYSFDICNYEWMGVNAKFNIIGNSVLKGDPDLSSTDGGSYKYFQGRTYSGGIFSYTANNIDRTSGARASLTTVREGGLWTAEDSYYDRTAVAADELGIINSGGYSNLDSKWKNMMLPDDISLDEYNASAISKKGNTLINYPLQAPTMNTRTPDEATKYVLQNAGAIYPVNDTLNTRYLAEGRTRLSVRSDYSFASAAQGIKLTEEDIAKMQDPTMAYGLPVHTHTKYEDKHGTTVYDVDGLDLANMTEEEKDGLKLVETYKFVSVAKDIANGVSDIDTLYVENAKGTRKFRIVLEDYEDGDGIYDAFEVYDVNNQKLTKPKNYATTGAEDAVGLEYKLGSEKHVLKFSEWGDGPGNYQHEDSYDDPYGNSSAVDTEWVDSDWPMLPTLYRDTREDKIYSPEKYPNDKFDSNFDGIPDFFVNMMDELEGWKSHPLYSPNKDISRLDFDGDGYTNIEEYINDYLCQDVEFIDAEENLPVQAENIHDGSEKYNTHRSHEILFNTSRRAKAQVYYTEGTELNSLAAAKRIDLNSEYDSDSKEYLKAEDFNTYFSVIFQNQADNEETQLAEGEFQTSLKPDTTYAYRIKTYSDTGVEFLSDVYTFTTKAKSADVPSAPRILKYIPFNEQITLNFEPSSPLKGYIQQGVTAPAGSKTVTTIDAPQYENIVDHYVIRYSTNAKFTDAKEVKLTGSATTYTITGLTNDVDYYVDLRAVNADGVESDPALYNFKQADELDELDKDGNKMYGVKDVQLNSEKNKVCEYFYDAPLSSKPIVPTKYVVKENYTEELEKAGIGDGETAKFTTYYGDVKDWYIYTLGGLPIPKKDQYTNDKTMLLLRDEAHEHGFTYAKTFDVPLTGKSTIHSKFMIRDEQLDPMNQNPEFRYYIQEDVGKEDSDADTDAARDATAFGNIVGMSFAKNEIKSNGEVIGRYEADVWYDVKILLDGDNQTYDVYINGERIASDLQYANYKEGKKTAVQRWQLGSRLAGTQDVYIDFMHAYTGWDEDAIDDGRDEVDKGQSGGKPQGGSGGSGGGAGGGANNSVVLDGDFSESGKVDNTKPEETTEEKEEHVNAKFNDMGAFAWAVPAVNALHEKGVVTGIGNNLFAPDRAVTRAEFITMLMRGFELIGDEAACSFTDVKDGDWCYPAIAMASSMGIVNGLPDGSFGVNAEVTRQDMTVMCLRLANAIGMQLTNTKGDASFADAADIADYAIEAVAALYGAGIVNGTGEGNFTPKGSANRAQAAKIIYEMMSLAQPVTE